MKSNVAILLFCIVLFFLISGCAGEEESPVPGQKASIKGTIVRPLPEKIPASESLPDSAHGLAQDVAGGIEKTAAVEAGVIRQDASEDVKDIKEGEAEGTYLTGKGDTLSIIAGRDDVMGDPLMWPLLYRLNISRLKDMEAGYDLPDRLLAEGIKLDLVTDAQMKDNLNAMPGNLWVINILSSTEKEKIIPAAVRLVQEGYYAYITTANVKGQDWMRLRAGFFEDRNTTEINGRKIKDLLNIPDIWTTRIGMDEFRKYAGYLSDTEKQQFLTPGPKDSVNEK